MDSANPSDTSRGAQSPTQSRHIYRPPDAMGSVAPLPRRLTPPPDMLTFPYYALMLWVGLFFSRYGQKLLNQGHRDDKGEPTQGMVGPVGFLVMGAAAGYLWFALLRALARGEVPWWARAVPDRFTRWRSRQSGRSRTGPTCFSWRGACWRLATRCMSRSISGFGHNGFAQARAPLE